MLVKIKSDIVDEYTDAEKLPIIQNDYEIIIDVMAKTIEHNIDTIMMLVKALDRQSIQLKIANRNIEMLNARVRQGWRGPTA